MLEVRAREAEVATLAQLKAPDATKVQVNGNFGLGKGGPWVMERGDGGVWTVTTPPVIPASRLPALSRPTMSRSSSVSVPLPVT